jgi:uncharacterized protein (DUF58 family)
MSKLISKKRRFERYGRIYILPTKFGMFFALSILVMILAGAIYNNNLVNLLAFLLSSLFVVSLVLTHNNLKDVEVEGLSCEDGFAYHEGALRLAVRNSASAARRRLEINPEQTEIENAPLFEKALEGSATVAVVLKFQRRARGKFTFEALRVASCYPLGLFRAWRWYQVQLSYFSYPFVAGASSHSPPRIRLGEQDAKSALEGGSDFTESRLLHPGEPPRRVDWRTLARGRPLMVKEFRSGASWGLDLDLPHAPGKDLEEKLSHLSQAVWQARAVNVSCLLHLPGATYILPNPHSYQQVLRVLSQYPPVG